MLHWSSESTSPGFIPAAMHFLYLQAWQDLLLARLTSHWPVPDLQVYLVTCKQLGVRHLERTPCSLWPCKLYCEEELTLKSNIKCYICWYCLSSPGFARTGLWARSPGDYRARPGRGVRDKRGRGLDWDHLNYGHSDNMGVQFSEREIRKSGPTTQSGDYGAKSVVNEIILGTSQTGPILLPCKCWRLFWRMLCRSSSTCLRSESEPLPCPHTPDKRCEPCLLNDIVMTRAAKLS